MSIGIELIMKDGTKDWIDPVDESEFDEMVINSTDVYAVKNHLHTYDYPKDDVLEIVKYQLHPCCGFDARGEHSNACENWSDDD